MGKEAVIAAGDRNAAAAEPQQAKRTGLPRRLVEYQVEQRNDCQTVRRDQKHQITIIELCHSLQRRPRPPARRPASHTSHDCVRSGRPAERLAYRDGCRPAVGDPKTLLPAKAFSINTDFGARKRARASIGDPLPLDFRDLTAGASPQSSAASMSALTSVTPPSLR